MKTERNFECPACGRVLRRAPIPGRKTIRSYCKETGRFVQLRRTSKRRFL